MGAIQRKDYNGAKDVAKHNEVLKRVNTQNSPYSVQATGHLYSRDKYIPVTEENVDALVGGERVLDANTSKYVNKVNKSEGTLVDIEIIHNKNGEPVVETLTRAEILASGTVFFATEGEPVE